MELSNGLPDPSFYSWTFLEQVLRGILPPPAIPCPSSPITQHILREVWSQPLVSLMLWAACCIGYLRFTFPSLAAFTDDMLSLSHVAVNSYIIPTVLTCAGPRPTFLVLVHIGRVTGPMCPVKALLGYLAVRGPDPRPLFHYSNSQPLPRSALVDAVLSSMGFDDRGFSFRIGPATAAAVAGVSDSMIKTLGRWRSLSFMTYIQTPSATLATLSSHLLLPDS